MNKIKFHLSQNIYFHKIYNFYKNYRFHQNKEKYIEKHFQKRSNYKLNLHNPQTFNEKLQWLKLYWYDEKAIKYVDKFEFRKQIMKLKLNDYLNDIYGVYDRVDQINLNDLPNQFVFKSTHSSGQVIICKDKNNMNWKKVKKQMKFWLKSNHYYNSFEWVYKNLKPRIICEKLIESETNSPPKDYKFFCFDGEPKYFYIASNRTMNNTKFDFYNMKFNKINVQQQYPNSDKVFSKPLEFKEMVEIARKLSKGFPHARVDLYNENGKIIIGEMTFFHLSGNKPFSPMKFDYELGSYLKLPNVFK